MTSGQPLGRDTNWTRVVQESAVGDLTHKAPTLRDPRAASVLVQGWEGVCTGVQVPRVGGQRYRPISSVGIVCLPLSIVPSQRVRGRKEEKHRGCQGRPGLLHSRGILPCWLLAFQGDYLTPTLPQLHKGSRGCSHQGCPIFLSSPPRSRPSQTSQTGKQR